MQPSLAGQKTPGMAGGCGTAVGLSCDLQNVLLHVLNRAEGVFLLALGETLGGAV